MSDKAAHEVHRKAKEKQERPPARLAERRPVHSVSEDAVENRCRRERAEKRAELRVGFLCQQRTAHQARLLIFERGAVQPAALFLSGESLREPLQPFVNLGFCDRGATGKLEGKSVVHDVPLPVRGAFL